MKEIKPLIPVNPEGLDKIANELLNENIPVNENDIAQGSNKVSNPKSYLILPGKNYGSYSYPDLIVETSRLGYDNEVEKAGKRLGLKLKNTAKENNGNDYIGKINWQEALKLNLALDSFTLNLRQYLDFLTLLKSGKAFYADGSKIDKKVLDNILDEIIEVRRPWRAEWLDAEFVKKGDGLYLLQEHKYDTNKSGKLEDKIIAKTQVKINPLMQDTLFDINDTDQYGLPKKAGSELYYWYPRNGSVAGFGANPGVAGLGCSRNPSDSYSELGVRRAKFRG